MTTLFDLRAERRADRAAAEEQRRANRAHQAALAQDMADRRATRRGDEADRRAVCRRDDQLAAQQRRQERRQERKDIRDERIAALPGVAHSLFWATVIVLPIALAWAAQAAFARDYLHIPVPLNQAFPASIETGAWVMVFEAHRRTRAGLPTGSLTRWTWVLAGIAAVINGAHGLQDAGPAAGLALAAISLLGVLLHSVRQGLDTAAVAGTRPGLALWRRARYPRLSLAAASIRAARELDQDTAWHLAWVDRYGVGPESSRRERALGRRIAAREAAEDRKAAETGDLMIVGARVQRSFAREVREIHDARAHLPRYTLPPYLLPFPAAEVPNPGTAEVRGAETSDDVQLSDRAAELLPLLQNAIEAEALLPNPGVKRITAYVRKHLGEGLGVPIAQELRDHLAGLRVVDADRDAS